MKSILLAVALAFAFPGNLFGQGQVLFTTARASANPPINSPIASYVPLDTSKYTAGLFLAGPGGSLSLIEGSLTMYRTGSTTAQQHVVDKVVQVPGHPGGSSVSLIYGAWLTSAGSFEGARAIEPRGGEVWGLGTPFTVTLTEPPMDPANPNGINIMFIPEPSTVWLGVLGAAALSLRRRR